jgi:hypothetical protein
LAGPLKTITVISQVPFNPQSKVRWFNFNLSIVVNSALQEKKPSNFTQREADQLEKRAKATD